MQRGVLVDSSKTLSTTSRLGGSHHPSAQAQARGTEHAIVRCNKCKSAIAGGCTVHTTRGKVEAVMWRKPAFVLKRIRAVVPLVAIQLKAE